MQTICVASSLLLLYSMNMEASPSKVSTSIALEPDLRARLDAEAARLDRSRSWLTAQAIREMLERNAGGRDA